MGHTTNKRVVSGPGPRVQDSPGLASGNRRQTKHLIFNFLVAMFKDLRTVLVARFTKLYISGHFSM